MGNLELAFFVRWFAAFGLDVLAHLLDLKRQPAMSLLERGRQLGYKVPTTHRNSMKTTSDALGEESPSDLSFFLFSVVS